MMMYDKLYAPGTCESNSNLLLIYRFRFHSLSTFQFPTYFPVPTNYAVLCKHSILHVMTGSKSTSTSKQMPIALAK